jgi:hypothetical protein
LDRDIKTQLEYAMIRGWTLVLYGTVESPQRDDEPRPSFPPSTVYSSINNYSFSTLSRSSSGNYGTTNPYTNRSQQQAQQKSSTVAVQTSTRKNGKQKIGKGNKNNNQRMSTTPKPFYTTVVLNPFGNNAKSAKNKSKYNQNASSVSLNRVTSTLRPRTTTRMPNSKSQSSSGKNLNLLTLKADKLAPEESSHFEKAPGKAPKQVKESSFPTSASFHDLRPTPNPSMTKMFERYEKIEQIYPELKPYKDKNNPAYFTVSNGNGNGKPSRENAKSFSSFVSMNSVPQKKNSNSDVSMVARQQVLSQPANEKIGKGTNQFILSQLLVVLDWIIFCYLPSRASFFVGFPRPDIILIYLRVFIILQLNGWARPILQCCQGRLILSLECLVPVISLERFLYPSNLCHAISSRKCMCHHNINK